MDRYVLECVTAMCKDIIQNGHYEGYLTRFGLAPSEYPIKVSKLIKLIVDRWDAGELTIDDLSKIAAEVTGNHAS